MTDRFLSRAQALDIVQHLLNSSRGLAEKVLKEAYESGEVRRQYPLRDPILLLPDDGILGMDLRPGAENPGGLSAPPLGRPWWEEEDDPLSEDDLLDWLNRKYPSAPRGPEERRAAEKADRKRSGGVKRANADRAVKAIWNGPPPEHLTPGEIVDKMARHLKAQGITNVGRDTMLRAAGKKH
jgi:hypothetical protein